MALDVGAELDGLERAVLADQAGDGVQLVGGLEAERRRVDGSAQLGSLERLGACRNRCHLPVAARRHGIVVLCTLGKQCHKPLEMLIRPGQ